jgi:N-acetylglucosamine-6-phosphate deacetylase
MGHKGRIVPGADADIVVLDEDLDVVMTFVAGRLAYQR